MVTRPRPNALRYFLVIGLHPLYALVALGAVVLVGTVTLMLQPQELDEGLGMVVVGQMFLASTGFAGRARRGQFDPLLVGAPDRMRVAAAHWLASTLPGAVAWLLLTTTAWLLGSSHVLSAIGGARAVALVIVSALSWAAGFWLPRGAAGMLWMTLLMVLVLQRAELLAVPAGSGFALTLAVHAATLIVCPFLLLGKHPPLAQGAVAIAMVAPLMVLLSVCRRSRRLDVYLLDRS